MNYEKVILEKKGNVAWLTLNNPERLNAWTFKGGMTEGFFGALDDLAEDDDIKVVIIKGAGRAFSSGHDLNEVGFVYGMGTGKAGERRASQRSRLQLDNLTFSKHARQLLLHPKITIAQIHGYCIGEGIDVALLCDLLVAAEDAQMGWTAQRLGFAGNTNVLPILFYTVGMKRALDLLLTGRLFSGKIRGTRLKRM